MTAPALTDEQLSIAFAASAHAALDEAYRRYLDVLYTVARGVLGNSGDAQDCVHDAVLRVWNAQSYWPARGSLRSFLIVCVRNEALSRQRAAARRFARDSRAAPAGGDTVDAFADPAQTMSDHVQLARLRDALATLPEEQRTVIELAYFGARTQTQIAAHLDIPLGTVKSRASLALRKLALALGADDT